MPPRAISSATYFSKTASELFCLVGEMTLIAHGLAEQHGYDLPLPQSTACSCASPR